jgi:hypothetical protein
MHEWFIGLPGAQLVSCAAPHLDEGVQLLITTDGELQMAGRDALHLWEGREVFEKGGMSCVLWVDNAATSYTHVHLLINHSGRY